MIEQLLIYPLKNLSRKKGRSILTILGVAIGVCSVIIINSIGNFGTVAVNTELDSLGMGGLTIATKSSDIPFTDNELSIIEQNSDVSVATPVYIENSDVSSAFGNKENSIIWGIDSNAKEIVSLQLMYGREISMSDISNKNTVCMVDQSFAQSMYNKDNAVGHNVTVTLQGNTENFTIIGVIKTGSGLLQSAMGSYVPNFVYLPYTTMQYLTSATNYNQIITKATPDTDIDTLAITLEKKLNLTNGTDDGSYIVTNLAKQKDSLSNILGIVTAILSAVGAVSLIVSGLSIMTVMLVSVSERKKEIGIKKAIGATRGITVKEFLGEAFMLSALGCIVGIVISYLLVIIASNILGLPISISGNSVVITCIFSVVSSIIFGVYPALKASKLKPAETLRAL